jgi:hypothetical protein
MIKRIDMMSSLTGREGLARALADMGESGDGYRAESLDGQLITITVPGGRSFTVSLDESVYVEGFLAGAIKRELRLLGIGR